MTVLWRRSALGDVVLLGAVTAALADPVVIVTAPEWVPVATRLINVARVVPWPKDADIAALRDAAGLGRHVDLQGSWRSRRTVLADARLDKRSVARRLRILGLSAGRPPITALYGEACGVKPVAPPWIDVPRRDRTALAVIPGAAWATKQWGADRYAAVARAWRGPVVILGGPDDAALCAEVAAAVPGAKVVCERGFDATIDALAGASVAVGGDTGLVHLAAACGARPVALFGPTHPDDGFAAWPGEVVSVARWCRPCTLHGRASCPLGHHACMAIAVESVVAAVERASCAG